MHLYNWFTVGISPFQLPQLINPNQCKMIREIEVKHDEVVAESHPQHNLTANRLFEILHIMCDYTLLKQS